MSGSIREAECGPKRDILSGGFRRYNASMRSPFIIARSCNEDLPVVAAGDGPHLIDEDGKRYLDASGGAAVSCLGHSNRAALSAARAQLEKIAYAHTGFFHSRPAEELAETLARVSPAPLTRACLVSGGSEAVESALKLARQYFVEIGQEQRRFFIARRHSYHGNTLGALSAGFHAGRRKMFAPLLSPAFRHVSPCRFWRDGLPGETEVEYADRLGDELESAFAEPGGENVCAFVAETVSGATLGAVPPAEGYFRRAREICDRHGALLILDEVMCGMGRTGAWFAFEREGVAPDIACVAKGLGAGVQPIGAALCSEEIHNAIAGGSGAFVNSHTYMGHSTACAAAAAVMREIESRNLLARVRELEGKTESALQNALGARDYVANIRGRGLLWGVELGRGADGRQPFPPEWKLPSRIKSAAMARGLICYPGGGTADGVSGDHILLAPPFIAEDSHIDEMAEKLSAALDDVFSALPGAE